MQNTNLKLASDNIDNMDTIENHNNKKLVHSITWYQYQSLKGQHYASTSKIVSKILQYRHIGIK